MLHHWYDILDHERPMASARIVRREKHAWPGGYELALVMSDGALLCAKCVTSEYHSISEAARDPRDHSGWRPEGIASADAAEESEPCAHCGAEIFAGVSDN